MAPHFLRVFGSGAQKLPNHLMTSLSLKPSMMAEFRSATKPDLLTPRCFNNQ